MTAGISDYTAKTVNKIEENTKLQNQVAQVSMDTKMADIFARMVKKVDETTQASV